MKTLLQIALHFKNVPVTEMRDQDEIGIDLIARMVAEHPPIAVEHDILFSFQEGDVKGVKEPLIDVVIEAACSQYPEDNTIVKSVGAAVQKVYGVKTRALVRWTNLGQDFWNYS